MSCGCKPKPRLTVVCCPPKRDPRCCPPKKDPCKKEDPCKPKPPKPCSCQQILAWNRQVLTEGDPGGPANGIPPVPMAAVISPTNRPPSADTIIYRDVGF